MIYVFFNDYCHAVNIPKLIKSAIRSFLNRNHADKKLSKKKVVLYEKNILKSTIVYYLNRHPVINEKLKITTANDLPDTKLFEYDTFPDMRMKMEGNMTQGKLPLKSESDISETRIYDLIDHLHEMRENDVVREEIANVVVYLNEALKHSRIISADETKKVQHGS